MSQIKKTWQVGNLEQGRQNPYCGEVVYQMSTVKNGFTQQVFLNCFMNGL